MGVGSTRSEFEIPVDLKQQVQNDLNLTVLDGVRWMSISLLFAFLAYFLANLFYFPKFSFSMALMDGTMFLTLLVLSVLATKKWIPGRWAHPTSAFVSFLAMGNVLYSSAVNSEGSIFFVPYIAIVLGSLMLSNRWLIFSLLVLDAASFGAAVFIVPENGLLEFVLMNITASLISFGIHTIRLRNQRRIINLRRQDSISRRELREALDRVEREFNDHKQTQDERRRLAEQLRQSQKMEAIGVLAGGIAHDMNNVLGAISASASLMKIEADEDDPRLAEIEEILGAAQRGGEFTRNLLGFARKGKFKKKPIRLNKVITEVERLLRSSLSKKIQIRTHLESDLHRVEGDSSQLSQAFMNLCINASEAMAGNGLLDVRTENVTLDEATGADLRLSAGNYVKLLLQDNGKGMDQQTADHAFDPFFTTKGPGEGTGLGLSMVYGAVYNHGGTVTIESALGKGTTVTVLLPSIENLYSSDRLDIEESGIINFGKMPETVLLVDDEAMIRSAAKRILRRLGCVVHLAANGQEAIDIYEKLGDEIDLVILDVAMPVMDGTECFRRLMKIDPRVRVLISSGYADEIHTDMLLSKGALDILPKPYNFQELEETVRRATGKVLG